jgi:hypothetical protein
MTSQQKEQLKKDTAARLRKPYADALSMLARCRQALHSLDPKDPKNHWPRKQLFISARSWVTESRAARFAYDAAAPDSTNDRAAA